MIKIYIIDKLPNIFTVAKHPMMGDGLALELKHDIFVSKEQKDKIITDTYYLDETINMHVITKLDINDPYAETGETPNGKYQIKFSYEVIPMTYNKNNETFPFNIINLLECIYKYNSSILVDEQKEILYNYFNKYHPEILNEVKQIEAISAIVPKTHISPVDKISNLTFGVNPDKPQLLFDETVLINVSKKQTKEENQVLIHVGLMLDDKNDVKGIEKFTQYDHAVHDAVCTLWDSGNKYMTPTMIYHSMTGYKDKRITDKHFNAITDSIERLRRIMIKINASNEMNAYNQLKEQFYEDYALPMAKYGTVKLNGEIVHAYILHSEPVLLKYAKGKNQISSVPITLLNTPINKTEENIVLQDYLLFRVNAMKNNKNNMSNIIRYEKIYDKIKNNNNNESLTKQKKEKIRDSLKVIFDDWVKKDFIKDYEEKKKGKSFYSIEINY